MFQNWVTFSRFAMPQGKGVICMIIFFLDREDTGNSNKNH